MPAPLTARRGVEARAGGVDLDAPGIAVAGPLLTRPLAVPRGVRLGDTPEGEPAILWAVPPPADKYGITQQWADGGTGHQSFWRFLELADERRPDRFVAFAQQFGVVGLWPYTQPTGHKVSGLDYWVPSVTEGIWTPRRCMMFLGDEDRELRQARPVSMLYEPVSEWRQWARWFRAAVVIGRELRDGRLAPRTAWAELDMGGFFDPEQFAGARRLATDVAAQRARLGWKIQGHFLKWSGLVPAFGWDGERPGLTLALGGRSAVHMRRTSGQQDWPENSLYPALVAKLLAVMAADQPTARCSLCDRIHPRRRQPRHDQPAYCDGCRPQARRAAVRACRARKKATRPPAPTPIATPEPADDGGTPRTKLPGNSRS